MLDYQVVSNLQLHQKKGVVTYTFYLYLCNTKRLRNAPNIKRVPYYTYIVMVKKSFVQSIADKSAKVNALCEYLGTLRTECVREYQKDDCVATFSKMHEMWKQISELSAKLESETQKHVLSDNTTINQNYESARNLVLSVDNNGKHKGAFIAYFDAHTTDKNELPLFYSVSECSGFVTKLYNNYLATLEDVRKTRTKRERLADRKARLLAEIAAIEEEENE